MVQFNPSLLDKNIAPGISEFRAADIPDLRAEFPQAEHWLSNHFLNTLFGPSYTSPFRQYAMNLMFRAQTQFALFHQAREATVHYLQGSGIHNPALRKYFTAVALWESCFLNYQIFVDIFKHAIPNHPFTSGNNSEEQRAYRMANVIKHWGGLIKGNNHSDSHTVPMWLTNDGFHCHSHALTYSEFTAITRETAKAANELQHPGAAVIG